MRRYLLSSESLFSSHLGLIRCLTLIRVNAIMNSQAFPICAAILQHGEAGITWEEAACSFHSWPRMPDLLLLSRVDASCFYRRSIDSVHDCLRI